MNTSQLKSFAQQSRKALMDTVSGKLDYVLDENSLARRESASAVSALEGLIKEIGKEQVIEKVAYTWFNRFCALRYMDVNRYNKIGIVSPVEGQTQPEILAEAKMNYIDDSIVPADKIADIRSLLNGTKTSKDPQGEAYKLLFVSYCNSLNKQLPFMFEKISDYTELLLPDDLLAQNSVLSNTIEVLDAETCKDIEVIGWLYQYYIIEVNEFVYNSNSKFKITKDLVPAATQIFTPKWIVSYMVENSVGKLWLESHPNERLQSQFKYYLESTEQEPEVQAKLDELINKDLKPQDIKVLDPACGSGHILVKAFDVLFEIYKSQGWQENEIPEMILKNNLYGLDICDRATQLAQFAVMMKARAFDRNIFNKVKELNICSIKDTNWMDSFVASEIISKCDDKEKAKKQVALLQNTYKDAKEYGSILEVKDIDFEFWNKYLLALKENGQIRTCTPTIKGRLPYILKQAQIMQQKYECVVTNPPYLGNARMSTNLSEYVSCQFPEEKNDLNMCFYKKAINSFSKKECYIAFITPVSWLSIKSFEKLRKFVIENVEFESLIDLGTELFEGKVGHLPVVSWVNKNTKPKKILKAIRLVDFCYSRKTEKQLQFFNSENYYFTNQNNFKLIPGMPLIAYWMPNKLFDAFKNADSIDKYSNFTGSQHITADNERFLRFHWEVNNQDIGKGKSWAFYSKGGEYRKWYGNLDYIVDTKLPALKFYKSNKTSNLLDEKYWFKEGISYSAITSKGASFREYPAIGAFDKGGPVICDVKNKNYFLGFFNSNLANNIFKILNPTVNLQVNDVKNLPILFPMEQSQEYEIEELVEENIEISKDDWNSYETSNMYAHHPLIRFKTNNKIKDSFNSWQKYKKTQFQKMKDNEEKINSIFAEIYAVDNEVEIEVMPEFISIKLANEIDDVKSLLSYAVGCMFGRYSLDEKGLAFAGGEFDLSKYKSFSADEDAVIPVLSEHLFSDDITSRFKEFLKVAFGETYFEENLEYVASVLGKKNTETADDTIRNYFMKDFYNDHIKMYQKRPIYWMFSSPKGNFNALVYMHRYNKDTASVILNSYLRNFRDEKLKAQIENCKQIELSASTSQGDKIKASKRREELEKIVKEVTDYERDILYPLATERKEIDLDDGVKVNYLKFGKALKDFGLKAKK